MRSNTKTDYEILGVDKNATDAEIDKAFREISRKIHPDMHRDKELDAQKEFENEYQELVNVRDRLKSAVKKPKPEVEKSKQENKSENNDSVPTKTQKEMSLADRIFEMLDRNKRSINIKDIINLLNQSNQKDLDAALSKQDEYGNTVLHRAAEIYRDSTVLMALIDKASQQGLKDAFVKKNKDGDTVLEITVIYQKPEIFGWLINNIDQQTLSSMVKNSWREKILNSAAQYNDSATFQSFINKIDPQVLENALLSKSSILLQVVAMFQDFAAIDYFLKKIAPLTIYNVLKQSEFDGRLNEIDFTTNKSLSDSDKKSIIETLKNIIQCGGEFIRFKTQFEKHTQDLTSYLSTQRKNDTKRYINLFGYSSEDYKKRDAICADLKNKNKSSDEKEKIISDALSDPKIAKEWGANEFSKILKDLQSDIKDIKKMESMGFKDTSQADAKEDKEEEYKNPYRSSFS